MSAPPYVAQRSVRAAAAPRARQRFMWVGQAARCQGRRSVVGAAEARGRVKPRSSAASVPPPRAGARRGHLGRSQVRRRRRRRSAQCRSGYAADT